MRCRQRFCGATLLFVGLCSLAFFLQDSDDSDLLQSTFSSAFATSKRRSACSPAGKCQRLLRRQGLGGEEVTYVADEWSSTIEDQMVRLAASVLPGKKNKQWNKKRALFAQLQDLAQAVLGAGAVALPFGSSANGCGEMASDLDIVLHLEPDGPGKKKKKSKNTINVLRRLARQAEKEGLITLQMIPRAKVPIVTLTTYDEDVVCDISYRNLLPLYNTKLLRTYTKLDPSLTMLVMVVKRWAKAQRLASTRDGYISSYAWTLLVVYYLQVCHGLPSLHGAKRLRREVDSERLAYEIDFASEDEVVWKGFEVPTALLWYDNSTPRLF
eukprot:TRINITY_DN47008_c0_g2_i4.p1 TRINITY_DN47008_c0_g2~~TRINITY_DN47008_c0_g2_i4.p1  ORF type:complete len:326 (-),score=52.24 TRINITY_DN47008_c0_g2_i4:1395-2372(-)